MQFQLHDVHFHVLPMQTRIPFRYGIASMTSLPHLFVTVDLEVGGRRFWGLFRDRLGPPDAFFRRRAVANYCPLMFVQATKTGRNVTPTELPAEAMRPAEAACDRLLVSLVRILGVRQVIGVGGYAEERARRALDGRGLSFGRVLHPSPASPAANRGWDAVATRELEALGAWD